mgnify:CR=1 FL=1
MKRLSNSQIVKMHSVLIKETGGLDGIRDENLLDSAVNAPFQTFDEEFLYKTLDQKAARLGYGIIKNHPFIDGNKRIGMLALMVFLELNGIELNCSDEDIIHVGLSLASGDMEYEQLVKWIIKNS